MVDGWVDEEAAHEDELLHAVMFGLLVASLNAGIHAAELQIAMSLSTDQANQVVQSYLKSQAAEHVKGINQTTREKLRSALAEGLNAKETNAELADRVRSVFTDAKGYRAQLIARTETAQAYSWANQQTLEGTGVVQEFSWLTAGSDACATCNPMHGKRRKPGKQYTGGLMPGFAHPACRCSEIGLVDES
jgi:SPP1 gp7 family putative phage head morphogenesis protein